MYEVQPEKIELPSWYNYTYCLLTTGDRVMVRKLSILAASMLLAVYVLPTYAQGDAEMNQMRQKLQQDMQRVQADKMQMQKDMETMRMDKEKMEKMHRMENKGNMQSGGMMPSKTTTTGTSTVKTQ